MLNDTVHKAAELDKVSNVHRHLVDLRRVVLLNVAQDTDVVVLHKVDRDTLAAETTRPADAVNVELAVVGEIIVDHEGHLLHVDATRPHVRCDQHSTGTRAEFLHDRLAFFLRHVAVHRRHREVCLSHLFCQPVNLYNTNILPSVIKVVVWSDCGQTLTVLFICNYHSK